MSFDAAIGMAVSPPVNGVQWRVLDYGFDTVVFRFDFTHDPRVNRVFLRDWFDPFARCLVTPRRDLGRNRAGGWIVRLDGATSIVASDNRASRYPRDTIKIVTRPVTLLSGDDRDRRLLRIEELPAAVAAARELIAEVLQLPLVDVPQPDLPRLDPAVDFEAYDCPDGWDLEASWAETLEALTLIPIGNWEPDSRPAEQPTSLTFRGARERRQFALYDWSAVHAPDWARGRRIRLERQQSPTSNYPTLEEVLAQDRRKLFLGPHLPRLLRSGGMAVCGDLAAADRLDALVRQGKLSHGRRRTLCAMLYDLAHKDLKPDERKRVRNELAIHAGITLDLNRRADFYLDLGPLFLTAASHWAEAAGPPVLADVPSTAGFLAPRSPSKILGLEPLLATPSLPVVAKEYDPFEIFDAPLELLKMEPESVAAEVAPPTELHERVLGDTGPWQLSRLKALLDRARIALKPPRGLRGEE